MLYMLPALTSANTKGTSYARPICPFLTASTEAALKKSHFRFQLKFTKDDVVKFPEWEAIVFLLSN